MLGEQVPAVGGEAAAVALGGVPVEAALGEELPGRPRARRGELLGVELGGGGVRGDQALPLALLRRGPGAGPASIVAQLDAGPVGQPLHRLDEAQVVERPSGT